MFQSGKKWFKMEHMFRGVHNLTIDAKGRIKIPVRHHEQIKNSCAGSLVLSIHPDDNCLLLYPLYEWQELERKVNALPSLNVHTKKIKRKLIGHAIDVEVDANNRLLLPLPLREYANFNKKVIVSGQGKNFEIWDEDEWHKHIKKLSEVSATEEVPAEVAKLAL